MRVISLGSGSSGNALLIEAGPLGRTRLLVDAGLPGHLLTARLQRAGVHPSQLQGILITHEHSDHIIGLPVLTKRYAIPIITAPETLAAIQKGVTTNVWTEAVAVIGSEGWAAEKFTMIDTSTIDTNSSIALLVGSRRMIGDIEVISFPVSHDAVAPRGYLLSAGGCRVCITIDSGEVTPEMLTMMQLADLLIIESNHDRERLLRGPYPYSLKQRILSTTGHLSNDQAATAVLDTWRTDSVRWLWLAHLSRTNNTPKIALNTMLASLEAARVNLSQVHISILPPGVGKTWDSTRLWHDETLWEMEK
jgi:phosphoribosyl 1,2-cyclic phosphodiesterase